MVTLHDRQPSEIDIISDVETIVIADDCLAGAVAADLEGLRIQLEIIKGAEIGDLADTILDLPRNIPQNIVMVGGVKHLHTGSYQAYTDNVMLTVQSRISAGAKMYGLSFYTEENLTPAETDNMQQLNACLQRIFQKNYIVLPSKGDGSMKMTADKRHYDAETVRLILYVIYNLRDFLQNED